MWLLRFVLIYFLDTINILDCAQLNGYSKTLETPYLYELKLCAFLALVLALSTTDTSTVQGTEDTLALFNASLFTLTTSFEIMVAFDFFKCSQVIFTYD